MTYDSGARHHSAYSTLFVSKQILAALALKLILSLLRRLPMPVSSARYFVACFALIVTVARVVFAAEVLIGDAKSQPESLTVAPGGVLIVGSASSPFVYKVRAGSSTAEKFIDASAEGPGTFFLGMLADASNNTLWTCQLTPVPNTTPPQRHSALRSFDLTTGAPKIRWNLPGDSNVCNDFAIGPDKALYITDTIPGRIFRLAPGASSAELYLEHPTLRGVDGITFLDGVLYVNNVIFNKLYRIPVDASGKAGTPVDIWMDQPVRGPDGMRAANGKLLLAENGSGKISAITVHGDKATVTVLKDGLNTPTGLEPAGDTIWIAERGAGKAVPIAMPKN
jgi:sugar lactone lactonase YvrE